MHFIFLYQINSKNVARDAKRQMRESMRVFRGECARFALDHKNRHRISSLIFIQQGCSAGGCTQMFSNSREQNIDAGQASPGQRPRRELRARERKNESACSGWGAPPVRVCADERARCAAGRAQRQLHLLHS
jgi:hypothetical protein